MPIDRQDLINGALRVAKIALMRHPVGLLAFTLASGLSQGASAQNIGSTLGEAVGGALLPKFGGDVGGLLGAAAASKLAPVQQAAGAGLSVRYVDMAERSDSAGQRLEQISAARQAMVGDASQVQGDPQADDSGQRHIEPRYETQTEYERETP